jgi:hypothetical protein
VISKLFQGICCTSKSKNHRSANSKVMSFCFIFVSRRAQARDKHLKHESSWGQKDVKIVNLNWCFVRRDLLFREVFMWLWTIVFTGSLLEQPVLNSMNWIICKALKLLAAVAKMMKSIESIDNKLMEYNNIFNMYDKF